MSPRQREAVVAKGGDWPPPSQGMLCFAEFFLQADGDQVLWDVSGGLRDWEYPIFYYSHGDATVDHFADTFESWLTEALAYFDLD